MTLLSKTDLLALDKCPRSLWLRKHRPDLDPQLKDASSQRRALDGEEVGSKAIQALNNPLWPTGGEDKAEAMKLALAAMAKDPSRSAVEVYLATPELYARADALIADPSRPGHYILSETKASSFPLSRDKTTPADPDPTDVLDAAIQLYVAQEVQVPLSMVQLNLLNNQVRHPGDGDYSMLFRPANVTAAAFKKLPEVKALLANAKVVLANASLPAADMGKQCDSPHACAYKAFCEKQVSAPIEHPLMLLPGLTGKNLARALSEDYNTKDLLQVPLSAFGPPGSQMHWIAQAHQTGKPHTNYAAAAQALDALPYPRFNLDFEGIDFAVPRWAGVRPYEQITFQWSCHIELAPGVFSHEAFLDVSGRDPTIDFTESLLDMIARYAPNGIPYSVVVFHATYERTRLREIMIRHPQFEQALEQVIDNIFDLLPLVQRTYYHPKMKGSYSIKKVLPSVCPALSYDELDDVQDGVAAQLAYILAAFEGGLEPEEQERRIQNMLTYCAHDTWAMVEVAQGIAGRPSLMAQRPPNNPNSRVIRR